MIIKNIILFELKDLIKSKWFFIYSTVVFIFSFIVIYFSSGKTNEIIATLTNFFLLVVPLYTMIFSVINLYESINFQNLLIIRGVNRRLIFFGKVLGLLLGLFLSFTLGILPIFIFYKKLENLFYIFFLLIFYSFLLHLIFIGIAFFISQFKLRLEISIGICILLWFFLYIIYDSIIFLIAINFGDYPLEKIILALLFLNPMDLIRTVLFIHGDLSIIMSYSSAIYIQVFGSHLGIVSGIFFLVFLSIFFLHSGLKKFLERDV
ncbi:MAG: hypothetical protein ACK4UJ_04035 [Leptonema sp. (in: bacteria)]